MQQHVSFLVRLWLMRDAPSNQARIAPAVLRITALNAETGEQWGFTEFAELLAFLQKQIPTGGSVGEKPNSEDAKPASGGKG